MHAATAQGEQRKTVTVLFCDVSGSTAMGDRLDPESLRNVMARYFDLARAVVERHEGSVEKFIGDAVMAVFGIPVMHEDDALRAVRAAVDLRRGLTALNEGLIRDYGTTLDVRMGINTGEVVTGTAERLATGDAVNVAARLEQAAGVGEILLGPTTRALLRDAVSVEAAMSLDLKGKPAPVTAYRLVALEPLAPMRVRQGVMLGRERELQRLRFALAQAVADRSCQLFTILGAAGVGKSRLTDEFLAELDDVIVARGTCLSYGEGTTYWPVAEALRQLLGDDPDARLDALDLDDFTTRPIRAVLGESGVVASVDEIAWATRALLEAIAADRPVVLVLDDIHWGQQAFFDLIDHVADLSRGAPIVLVCMARPELLDRQPNWGGGKMNATTVLLESLGADHARALLVELLDGVHATEVTRGRILEAAEGNPFFVEEMVALLRESPAAVDSVPPTIQAVLAARLDRLDPDERGVLERGSIEGRVFHRGAVQALSPAGAEVTLPLTALVRRELLRPERPQFAGHSAYRFRHLLIRDAAYDAIPKRIRAELHENFARWIDGLDEALVELDEIVGYHLERAYRYRLELGPVDPAGRLLADQAAERLCIAGTRAAAQGDARSAVDLLGRVADLFERHDPRRLRMLPGYGRALSDSGQLDRADQVLSEAVDSAGAPGGRTIAADAAVVRTNLRLHSGSTTSHRAARRDLDEARRTFEELGDESGLAQVLGLTGMMRFWAGDVHGAMADLDRAAQQAEGVGSRQLQVESLQYLALSVTEGPTPAEAALARLAEIRERGDGDRRLEVSLLRCGSLLEAMCGRFDVAERLVAEALELTAQLGLGPAATGVQLYAAQIQLMIGRPDRAEQLLTPAVEALVRMGDTGHLATVAPVMADVLFALGRAEEAERFIELAEKDLIDDDMDAQIACRRTRAKLLAHRGEYVEADRLALEAMDVAQHTDFLNAHAVALDDLATVHEAAGHVAEALDVLDQAIRLHELKGNLPGAARASARRAALVASESDHH